MINRKGLDFNKVSFCNIETSEVIEFDSKIETIEVASSKKEKNEKATFPEININIEIPVAQSKEIYHEFVGKYVEKFIKDCYEGKYSYQEIVYLLKNGKI